MAFLVKNKAVARLANPGTSAQGGATSSEAYLSQHIHVTRAGGILPASTTEWLFAVRGGRVAVKAMIGTATVVLTSTNPGLSINASALSVANPQVLIGTTMVIATTVNLASLEKGGMAVIEGDGTAIVKADAGAAFAIPTGGGFWIAPAGEIYATTTGTNTTGEMKWDIWYLPLDEGAYVEAKAVGSAII